MAWRFEWKEMCKQVLSHWHGTFTGLCGVKHVRMMHKIASACSSEHTPSESRLEGSISVTEKHCACSTIVLISALLNPVATSSPTISEAPGVSVDSQSLYLYASSSFLSASSCAWGSGLDRGVTKGGSKLSISLMSTSSRCKVGTMAEQSPHLQLCAHTSQHRCLQSGWVKSSTPQNVPWGPSAYTQFCLCNTLSFLPSQYLLTASP